MKTLTTSLRNSFLLCALTALPAAASPTLVGKVHAVKGESFLSVNGKTETLRKDMDIADGAKVVVSDDAQVTIGDFYDRRYHLAGGSQLVLGKQSAILQKGKVWTQAVKPDHTTQLSTANLLITASKSEFVVTYDAASQTGQLSVINGSVDVASPIEPSFKQTIEAGQFTSARPDANDGFPRSPTVLSYDSMIKTVALFPGVKPLDEAIARAHAAQTSRGIASVGTEAASVKPKILVIKTYMSADRAPASVNGSAQKYFVQKTKSAPTGLHTAKVRVIGYQAVKIHSARNPASSVLVKPQGVQKSVKPSEFLKSFELHQQNQPAHSKEVQRLIDDLKSY